MFAAIDAGSDSSVVCPIMARSLAENVSRSVCLVHADFRTPALPNYLMWDNHYGFADFSRRDKPTDVGLQCSRS